MTPNIKKFKGTVIKGHGDGRKFGIPTANLKVNKDLTNLKHGVYAVFVRFGRRQYKGVAHYGPRAVFDEVNPVFEVHILNFNEDIYGKELTIELIDFIRPTEKFKSIEQMQEQIADDKLQAIKTLDATNK